METSYALTHQERVLAEIQLSIFYYHQFEKRELPGIFISDELINIEAVSKLSGKDILRKSIDDIKKDEINKYCIDLLGLYCPEDEKIILFTNRIKDAAEDLKIKNELLQQIVLLHEIGHWISHKLAYKKKDWELDKYNKATVGVHEGLAQLYTWWVVENFLELKEPFNTLNEHQSPPYLVWKYFINSSPKSLVILREFESVTKENWLSYDFWIIQQPNMSIEGIMRDHRGAITGESTGIN
ncbi:MAG: hypothetical protein IPH42_05830 [Bacteroidetes bacterium]|nr:hypothetical protein [Bacteroidota bacterium]